MSDPMLRGGRPVSDEPPICPWCSAALPSATETRCPSCDAALHEEAAEEIPGVTRVDHEAILRARASQPRSRGLMGWLAGDSQAEAPTDAPGTLAPPPDEVRREMLRLEVAALEAEAKSRQAEVEAAMAAAGIAISPAEPVATDGAAAEPLAADDAATVAAGEPAEASPDAAADAAQAAS